MWEALPPVCLASGALLSPPALVSVRSDAKVETRAVALLHCVASKNRAFWRQVMATNCCLCNGQHQNQHHPLPFKISAGLPKGGVGKRTVGIGGIDPESGNSRWLLLCSSECSLEIVSKRTGLCSRGEDPGIPEQYAESLGRLLKVGFLSFCRCR